MFTGCIKLNIKHLSPQSLKVTLGKAEGHLETPTVVLKDVLIPPKLFET